MLFSCSLEHVDVNVTPDKRKVMLHQEKALLLLIKVRQCCTVCDYRVPLNRLGGLLRIVYTKIIITILHLLALKVFVSP